MIKARKPQAAPRKVQHRLFWSLRNVGKNVHNQAAQHILANHLFKLPHTSHIYNNQGKRKL